MDMWKGRDYCVFSLCRTSSSGPWAAFRRMIDGCPSLDGPMEARGLKGEQRSCCYATSRHCTIARIIGSEDRR